MSVKTKIHKLAKKIQKQSLKNKAVFVFALLMITQLLLPGSRALPKTSFNGEPVGLESISSISQQIKEKSEVLKLSFAGDVNEYEASETGVTLDTEATLANIPTLTLQDKLVPFKPWAMMLKESDIQLEVTKDEAKIIAFAELVAEQQNSKPENAKATIKDGQLVITKEDDGEKVEKQDIIDSLLGINPFEQDVVEVPAEVIPAKVTSESFSEVKSTFDALKSQKLQVKYGDTTKVLGSKQFSSMLQVSKTKDGQKWKLTFKDGAISEQISNWARDYNTPAGVTQIEYRDDVEVSRNVGPSGSVLSEHQIKAQLKEWIQNPTDKPVGLKTEVVVPTLAITRTYSWSSAQLQAKLDSWIAVHGGRYQVAIRELGGRGREASYNVSERTVMASTYKTFLAYVAYSQAENGALNLNTTLSSGHTISKCIEVMMVNSNNECAIALGKYIGWAKVDQIIAAAGFQNVKLNNYDSHGNLQGDKLVNAKEQAKFLAQLSDGSLMNSSHTSAMLGYMKRQVYREGIPAGSPGATVANKVGFLDAYIHDIGIVYGPKSTYALVIMSEGSNWSNISSLASAVYDFMNN